MEDFVLYRPGAKRFRDLNLNFCGYEACDPLHGFGPAVRPNYIIHYILEGRGIYRVGDTTWNLAEGEGFLIEPGTLTFYQADAKEPWTYLWVGFEGDFAKSLVKSLGFDEEHLTFRCSRKSELKALILSMLKNNTWSESNDFLLESQLYQFFSIMLKDAEPEKGRTGNRDNIYIRSAEEYIRNSFSDNVKVADIAAYIGIHRSYLYTLFEQQLGMSPQQYLTRYRLSRAAELLATTEYSVESIAVSCGYPDPQVFTKAFKASYGVTPSKYRKRQDTLLREHLMEGQGRLDEL